MPGLRSPRRLLLSLLVAAPVAYAQTVDPIVTDRPDYVESSNVVGAGRFQFETSVAYERFGDKGFKATAWSTPTLLRLGVSDTVELRLETDGRVRAKAWAPGAGSVRSSGFADTAIGLKWHTADGEGGSPSIGWLLHADLDSGSSELRGSGIRPSLRVVAEWELPHGMSFGVMPGVSYEKNDDGDRYVNGSLGIVLGKALTERLRGFAEIAAPAIASSRNGGSEVSLNGGVAYLLTPLVQVDTAVSRGLNSRTADASWTFGLSMKF
ncbi:transporter [Pseudoduganella sp. GCM10020061]|uniref:transporter n=1 Tax=Pseudoduganella sp. GCM10020061 TaxID=3317345 RepID=UPI003634E422